MGESDLPIDIFNSRYFGEQSSPAPSTDLKFLLFAQLPRELRHQIWTYHLPRRRFLRVLVEEGVGAQHGGPNSEPGELDDDDEWAFIFTSGPSETETNPSADPAASLLRVTFLGDPSPEMLALRLVCREARHAHNSVYRIRLPALARIPWGIGAHGYTTTRIMAYLNPELDILSLQTPDPPKIVTLNLLPFFLHHLLQRDFSPGPLRFGVRHLCVELRHLGRDYSSSEDDEADHEGPAPLAPDVLASVRLAVSNLRSLYLRLTTRHQEPRVMSGPFANMRSAPWYNASFPVLPVASWGFPAQVEPVQGGDPRLAHPDAAADLRQLWISDQIRPSLDVWAGLQSAWGVPAAAGAGTRVRALVALDAEGWAHRTMHDGSGGSISLGAYLREERADWKFLMDPALEMGAFLRPLFQAAQQNILSSPGGEAGGGDPLAVDPQEWILRRQPHTAVGFWLIDSEVLEAAKCTGPVGKRIVNLSERGPEDIELWVFGGES